jgi:membrane-bound serine protease (ClpP class)
MEGDTMKLFWSASFFLFLTLTLHASAVLHMQIHGAVSPSSSSYLEAAVQEAGRIDAGLLLIELDTPGGLVTSMREMIRHITNSPVPVAVYVAPKGAHAASAGTYLTYAAHIAAMAPGTNIGAATPIAMMAPGGVNDANASRLSVAGRKARNDAKAYIKSLAQMHDRNITWALQAVDEARSLSAVDALRIGVIDLIAENVPELLRQIDGRTVSLNGTPVTLRTASAEVVPFEADWKTLLLGTLTNPNIAYILLLVAIYGILFEMMNPGTLLPGTVGVIAGVFALYALNLLPFNYAGLLLILLGIAFMIAEVFVAGFGVLGIGGAVAFAAGSFLLFDAETLGTDISLPLIIAFSLISIGFFVLIFGFLWRVRRQKALGGSEEMVGAEAEVLERRDGGYRVRCHGELWQAVSDQPLRPGDRARVTGINRLTLILTKE